MEYERIDKSLSRLSPTKLRMKLMGSHGKKDGSNSNSSRTSPSRIEDSGFVNRLLASKNEDFDNDVPSLDVAPVKISDEMVPDSSLNDQSSSQEKEFIRQEIIDASRAKLQQCSSAIHPMRMLEDESLDYDSNASSSSFEFHKAEREAIHNSLTRSYSRPMSSKWNDAEKWIMSKQNVSSAYAKNGFRNHVNRCPITHTVRVAPESADYEQRSGSDPVSSQTHGGDFNSSREDTIGLAVMPGIRSVCMRDMGTEMTPVASQDPSRTATPVGATTPFRSPTSSIPTTPRGGVPTTMPTDHESPQHCPENEKKELSDNEKKLKTRREIVALGVQLGKTNIAEWASKYDKDNSSSCDAARLEELERIEYEKRADAWEEVEKTKHTSSYKREEIEIQAWECRQKAKLEAEMRRIEAKVEQMRLQAQAKMIKKIAIAKQRSEEKRASAEARKNRDAEKTSAQAEYIRKTGRMPSSTYVCCGWLSL